MSRKRDAERHARVLAAKAERAKENAKRRTARIAARKARRGF